MASRLLLIGDVKCEAKVQSDCCVFPLSRERVIEESTRIWIL